MQLSCRHIVDKIINIANNTRNQYPLQVNKRNTCGHVELKEQNIRSLHIPIFCFRMFVTLLALYTCLDWWIMCQKKSFTIHYTSTIHTELLRCTYVIYIKCFYFYRKVWVFSYRNMFPTLIMCVQLQSSGGIGVRISASRVVTVFVWTSTAFRFVCMSLTCVKLKFMLKT